MENLYIENGYKSRKDYLENLALDMGIDKETVFTLASLLGSVEDFDGLVSSLEDYSIDSMGYYSSDNLTTEQEIHNSNLDAQLSGI